MTKDKPYLDMALVLPLPEELDAVIHVFGFKADLTVSDFQITELNSPNENIRICLIKQHQMGQSAARLACDHLLSHMDIGILCSFGIAGALSADTKLGDICVSQMLYDLTENSKYVDTNKQMDIHFSPRPFHVERGLCSRLAFLTQNPALSERKRAWLSQCETSFHRHLHSSTELLGDRTPTAHPSVHFGTFVSSNVTASETFKERIQQIDRKVIAIDTESSGVYEVSDRTSNTLSFSLRGISDLADSKKTELEERTNNSIRCLAVENAATYLYHQLLNEHFADYLLSRQSTTAQNTSPNNSAKQSTIGGLLSTAESHIEHNLRESCPAYRTKSKGYVLPPPRISPPNSNEVVNGDRNAQIQEIGIAIEHFDRILISLEFTYPDNALCWVIADHLFRTNGERVFLPTVIQGAEIRVGRFDLRNQERIIADGVTPVIIVDNPDVRSKRHMDFLVEQANKYPDIKFIILSKDNKFTIDAGDFLSLFDCRLFHSTSVSLLSLSHFISSNFDMVPQQADYAAIRLWEVFEKFNMHAHPSYFAGISQDVLYALITANRRGELIQLAVEGALMLMVASDKGDSKSTDVAVSRTFRKRFLTELIVCQEILKEPVSEERAVTVARELAEQYDLDISPARFVGAFIDVGLINFEGGRVGFSASYVRDYLLAEFLAADPTEAISYFDLEQQNLNLNVMDIYAEIGPEPRLIEAVISAIMEDIAFLDAERQSTKGFLIDDRPQPRMLTSTVNARAKKKSVEKAVQYVGENPSDLARKQTILDFRHTVANRVVEYRQRDEEEEERERGISRARVFRHWRAGCTLLGGGAEQIERDLKRRLAGLLIRLGNRISEVLTAEVDGFDFGSLRDSAIADENFIEMEVALEPSQRHRLREDLQRVIDLIEYELCALPYRAILHSLCATGWENTLRLTVRECEMENAFDELTRAIWVSDLQPESAKEVCEAAFVSLGNARMLRCLLADHFVSRVYWDKWKRNERSKMLDLAYEIIAPLGVSLKKSEISRAAQISERKKRKKRRARRKRR